MIANYTNITIIPVIATQAQMNESTGSFINGSWSGFLKEIMNENVDTVTSYYQFTQQRAESFVYSYPVYNVKHSVNNLNLNNILGEGDLHCKKFRKRTFAICLEYFRSVFYIFVDNFTCFSHCSEFLRNFYSICREKDELYRWFSSIRKILAILQTSCYPRR